MKYFLTTLLNGRLGRCLKTASDVLSYQVLPQSDGDAVLDVTFKKGNEQKIHINRYDLSTFDNEVDPIGTIVIPPANQVNATVYENKTLLSNDELYKAIVKNLVLYFNDEKINIPLKEVSIVTSGSDVYLKAREKSLVFKGELKLVGMLNTAPL